MNEIAKVIVIIFSSSLLVLGMGTLIELVVESIGGNRSGSTQGWRT